MNKLLLITPLCFVACGGGGGITGPSQTHQDPVTAPLAVPARLRAVWAPASIAAGPVARLSANAVLIQIESWGDDLTSYAKWSRERGVGALPYVGQCFELPRGAWDGCWNRVETWSKPLREAGILWGYQGLDEPAHHDQVSNGLRDTSNSYIKAKGFDVFSTEWIQHVTDTDPKRSIGRPPGVRWYTVTCYAFASRTPWHVQGCAEEYSRHPDWDTVTIPEGPTYNMATGHPWDMAKWEAIAGNTKSIAFWSPESE